MRITPSITRDSLNQNGVDRCNAYTDWPHKVLNVYFVEKWSTLNAHLLFLLVGAVQLQCSCCPCNNSWLLLLKKQPQRFGTVSAGSGSKQRTVRSNYVYRTVKTCKSLKCDVHEQMCCGYNDSTINTFPSTAFAANRLKMVRRRCKHPTRLHIERFAASIYSQPYFSRQSVARCKTCM